MTSVVLVGGLAMRGSEFEPIADRLRAAGLDALTFDNLQSGNAPRIHNLSIEAQAEHAWDQVESRLGTSKKVTIFGLSMGGMIAATMANMHPDRIQHLILGATSPNVPEAIAVSDELYEAWLRVGSELELYECVRIAFGQATELERPEVIRTYYESRLSKANGQSRRDFATQLDSIRAFNGMSTYTALPALAIPTSVIAGEEDRLFPDHHTNWISKNLGCQKHIIGRTGHMLHLENEAELLRILIEISQS